MTLRRNCLAITLVAATVVSACASSADESLHAFLGPPPNQTAVITETDSSANQTKSTTVASVALGSGAIATCSPATQDELPEELRQRGARPIIARLEIRDDELVSTLHGRTRTLLKAPLRVGAPGWLGPTSILMGNADTDEAPLECKVADRLSREILGEVRDVIVVRCEGRTGGVDALIAQEFASGIGMTVERTELRDSVSDFHSVIERRVVAIQTSNAECAAHVLSRTN